MGGIMFLIPKLKTIKKITNEKSLILRKHIYSCYNKLF